MMALRSTPGKDTTGHFVSMLTAINVDHPLSVLGVSRDCIAIYGANATQEGAALILYNTQFKVIESKQSFKVFFTNSRLWTVDTYIFLAAGQKLAVFSFRISKEQLSDMLGSQRSMNLTSFVDTECINTDAELEEQLEFDSKASSHGNANGTDTNGHTDYDMHELNLDQKSRAYEQPDDVIGDLRSMQQNDIQIDINLDDDLLADMVELKLSASTKSQHFDSKTIHLLVAELERIGESEISISNMIIPMCIESNLPDDLVVCIRNYTNISEKMLVISIKYFIGKIRTECANNEDSSTQYYSKLNAVLSCSFQPELMLEQLRAYLNFEDVILLLNHIYAALTSDTKQLEERPQCGDTEDDEDILLVKWFTVIIDSHFHQFILSRDSHLIEKLTKWKESVDGLLVDIQQSKTVSAMLYNLLDGKLIAKENIATKWYSIEEVKLY